jgi:hypothetical protein
MLGPLAWQLESPASQKDFSTPPLGGFPCEPMLASTSNDANAPSNCTIVFNARSDVELLGVKQNNKQWSAFPLVQTAFIWR